MSWNKNTSVMSQIDNTIKLLISTDTEYELTVLSKIKGLGLNDEILDKEHYFIRRLSFRDKVMIEQMQRSYDCDFDDHLVSISISKDEEKTFMKDWKAEIYIDEDKDICEE